MREPDGYRETLAWIMETTGKGWLTTVEISRLLGVTRQTVARRFGISAGCAATVLALKLAKESR